MSEHVREGLGADERRDLAVALASDEGGGIEVRVDEGPLDESAAAMREIPAELPVLPLKNTVLFPFLLSPLLVNTPRSQELIDEVLLRGDRLMVCAAVRRETEGSPGPDDVHRTGTLLRVVKMLKFPDDSYRLLVQGVARVHIDAFTAEDPFLRARVRRMEESGDATSVEMQALTRNVTQAFLELAQSGGRIGQEVQALAANVEDPSRLADLVASNLGLDVAGKQAVLEEPDVAARLKLVQAQLTKEQQALAVETEIKEKVQSEMTKSQRDYVLRQQLEAIRRELGETEDGEQEVEDLRERLEAAGLPEDAHEQAMRELERLEQTPPAAAEHGVIRTYLEWLADLPWKKLSEDRLDVVHAREVLDEDHYGLEKVKDRIVEYIAVLSLKRDIKGPILCFVGPPGTGKTSLGRSIARALGREFGRISLGGVRDEAEIRGHRRTYVGALPGRIVQTLRRAGTRNPVLLLDEIDKVGTDFRGDPSSALLEVLDPEQNAEFSDHYLEVPFDLSRVLFIATANRMDTVPPALRDRMEVIELPGYTLEEKREIARRFLVPRQRERNGIAGVDLDLPDETISALVEHYTREAGVRNLERRIAAVFRKLALRVAEGESVGAVKVAPADLEGLLGPHDFEPEVAERGGKPGVAVGLAWTPAGGDILFVESTRMKGQGELKLTGSLGDVMRESAEAARTWLRGHAEELGVDDAVFAGSDLHVHVPSGAVPKDGPSAGVAMVTSLASLYTGRPAAPLTAMTGEITLRGKILPVGGIKEKVLAAKRAGIERVVLPAANEKDVAEIPAALLQGLDLRYVGTIDDALGLTLDPAPSSV
ncbi:MAG: endopeptidase La [Myxococcota bacterium]